MKKILLFVLCLFAGLTFTGCFDDGGGVDGPSGGGEKPKHEHVFNEWVQWENGDCYKKSVERRVCQTCGEEDFRETDYVHYYITRSAQDPTCENVGWNEYQECQNCGDKKGYQEIPATGHLHIEIVPDGSNQHYEKCTDCDQTVGNWSGHNFDDGVVTPAECLVNGKIVYTCADCGYFYEDTIWCEGHKPGDEATCTTDQICTVCEEVLNERTGHTPVSGGCTEGVFCAVCDEPLEDATGHTSSGEATCTEHEYCTVCFENINYPTHTFVDHICTECGEFELSETLEFELSFDTEYFYRVVGIGTPTSYLVIPNVYQGLPVKEIEVEAFEGDTVLEKVYIPSNIKFVGSNAFNNCTNLVSIFLAEKTIENLGINWSGSANVYVKGEYTLNGIVPTANTVSANAEQAYLMVTNLIGQLGKNYSLDFEHSFKMDISQGGVTQKTENSGTLNYRRAGDTLYAHEVVSAKYEQNGQTYSNGVTANTTEYYNDGYLYSHVTVLNGQTANSKQYCTLPINQFMDNTLTLDLVNPSRADFAKAVMVDNGDGSQSIVLSTENGYTGAEMGGFINFDLIPIDLQGFDFETYFTSDGAQNSVVYTRYDNGKLAVELHLLFDFAEYGYAFSYDSVSVFSAIGSTSTQICPDKSSYALHNHSGDMNTCGEVTCRTCKNIVKEATDHTFDTKDCLSNTCTVCGETVETDKVHIYEDGECLYCGLKQGTNNLEYELSYDGTYYTVKGLGYSKATKIVIPSTHEGLPVKSIGYYAFNGTNIESVYIPDSVTSIGDYAFQNCSQLKSLTIPASVTTMNTYSMLEGCTSLETLVIGNIDNINYFYQLGNDAVKEIIVLGGTAIDDNTFRYFKNLERVELGEGIIEIGYQAFLNLEKLTEVVLPESLEKLGQSSFRGCSALESIVIPSKVTELPYYLFADCTSLSNVEIEGQLTNINTAFYNCTSLESFVVPETVTEISSGVFNGCTNLKDLTINVSLYKNISRDVNDTIVNVTLTGTGELSEEMFKDATNLETVVFPQGITTIPQKAFSGCTSLRSVEIPDSVTRIETQAFYQCSSLEDVILSENSELNTIGGSAFSGCTILKELPLTDGITSLGNGAFQNCLAITEVVMPAGLTSSPYYLFAGCDNVTKITIDATYSTIEYLFGSYPSKLKEVVFIGNGIEEGALSDCTTVEKVVISDTITTLNRAIFNGCVSLQTVEMSKNVEEIRDYVFSGCYALESITIPATVKKLGHFIEANENVVIYYEGTIDEWVQIQYNSFYTTTDIYAGVSHFYLQDENGEYYDATEATELTISKDTEVMYANSLSMFRKLEKISLPVVDSDLNIVDLFFEHAPVTLTEVVVNGGVPYSEGLISVHRYFFDECINVKVIEIAPEITSIAQSALYDCVALEKITLPFAGTAEGDSAYTFRYLFGSGDSAICPVTLSEVVITTATSIRSNAFDGCINITSITLPDNLVTIGRYAFRECAGLTELEIPSTVTSIGEYAFYYCENLTELVIPEGVEVIEAGLFTECSKLATVTLPSTITTINNTAFSGCDVLENVYYNNTPEQWLELSFNKADSNPMYYAKHFYFLGENDEYYELVEYTIPESITTINQYAFAGLLSLKTLTIPSTVESIGKGALFSLANLETLEIPYIGGSLTENKYFGYIFTGAGEYWSQSVPESLTKLIINGGGTINSNAFYQNNALKEVVITGDITSISNSAFYDCNDMEKVVIGKNVETIGEYAFRGCGLVTVEFEENSKLTTIGNNAFYNCSSLVNLTLPATVTTVGTSAFSLCNSLENIYYEGTLEDWNNITFGNYANPLDYAKHFYLLDENGEYKELTEIVLPTTITTISSAYKGFRGVTTLTIPTNITSAENYIFSTWESLTTVYYQGTIEDWCKISFVGVESNPMNYAEEFYLLDENGDYYNIFEVTELTIKGEAGLIGSYQFFGLENLETLTICDGVESIGGYAFYYAPNITKLTVPFVGQSIEEADDKSLMSIFYYSGKPAGLTDIIVTGGASISYQAFYNLSTVINLTIPASTRIMRSQAFYGMNALENVYFTGTIEDWCNISIITSPMEYAENFYYLDGEDYVLLTELVIPETVTIVKQYQFAYFKITKLTITANVTTIEKYAFYECDGLTTVFIPATVTTVGDSAFARCSNISKIYCEATSRPSGWHNNWYWNNSSGHSYQFGATNPDA